MKLQFGWASDEDMFSVFVNDVNVTALPDAPDAQCFNVKVTLNSKVISEGGKTWDKNSMVNSIEA